MKNNSALFLLFILISAAIYPEYVWPQSNSQKPLADGNKMTLIELGLTTDRSKTKSGDGAFSAIILAKSGLVVALYNCQVNVERVIKAWAKENHLKLIEKSASAETLHLTYASNQPAGYFILDYDISSNLNDARIDFRFRTLTNVKLSGDQMGLEPLGQDLLEAMQCVPH